MVRPERGVLGSVGGNKDDSGGTVKGFAGRQDQEAAVCWSKSTRCCAEIADIFPGNFALIRIYTSETITTQ